MILTLFLAAGTALASENPKLQWEKELNKAKCGAVGAPIINVTQKVINDVESGVMENWVFNNYERRIQVFKRSGGATYCALVSYKGTFKSIAGRTSPQGTGKLSGKEKGTMEGGYRTIITGTLKANPTWPIRGFVGTADYKCNINVACPGHIDWATQYFNYDPYVGFTKPWWGWIYRGGNYGTWINAITGNFGDILPAKAL